MQFHTIQNNLNPPQMVPGGGKGTIRGGQTGAGEEKRPLLISRLHQRRRRKRLRMSYGLLDQGRELPNEDKPWTSPTGSGPGIPVTAAGLPFFFYLNSRLLGKRTECGPQSPDQQSGKNSTPVLAL